MGGAAVDERPLQADCILSQRKYIVAEHNHLVAPHLLPPEMINHFQSAPNPVLPALPLPANAIKGSVYIPQQDSTALTLPPAKQGDLTTISRIPLDLCPPNGLKPQGNILPPEPPGRRGWRRGRLSGRPSGSLCLVEPAGASSQLCSPPHCALKPGAYHLHSVEPPAQLLGQSTMAILQTLVQLG